MIQYNKAPYKVIPDELRNDYTMNGQIHVFDWWLDDSKKNGVKWDNNLISSYVNRFTPNNIINNCEGPSSYSHEVCLNLLNAFQTYNILNKNVAVIGSETPWIEAILINLRNKVTTIEYNVPECKYDNLTCKDYFEYFEKNTSTFDAIITFSSIEYSGLGRYGDPLDPNGDIKTMECISNNLLDNGILIWGAPIGKDALSWNAHRVYGEIRLPLIFNKFEELKWYGANKKQLFEMPLNKHNYYQPVVVLKKKKNLLDSLVLYESPYTKYRIGGPNDGGYIIVNLPGKYDLFISGGISDNINFEKDLLRKYPNLVGYAFDGTINSMPDNSIKNIKYIKKNFEYENNEFTTNLYEYMTNSNNIFMKLDIEGHEFRVLPSILENDNFKKIKQLVVEIHSPADIELHPRYYYGLWDIKNKNMFSLFEKINNTHTLVHFHANNACKTSTIDGIVVPNVFELTYIRNEFITNKIRNTKTLPTNLDMPNKKNLPEYFFKGYPYTI